MIGGLLLRVEPQGVMLFDCPLRPWMKGVMANELRNLC